MRSVKEACHIILQVAWREINLLLKKPLYIFSSIAVMAFCAVFFLTLFKTGSPEKMPIGIVDHDRSSISRRACHEIEATQSVHVAKVYDDFASAREDLQRGKIYAILDIPENFYADLVAFKQPELVFYTNMSYTLAGTTAYKQLLMMMNLVNGAFQREVLRKKGMPEHLIMKRLQPVAIDGHFLDNPYSNYAVYLLGVILPGILGVIVLMMTIYSLASELKWRTSRELLKVADDCYSFAILGKMIPYTILYFMMGFTLNVVMFKMLHFPVHGSFTWLNVGMMVYILAIQSMAVTFVGLVPALRDALSVGALYGMLSFSLSGFTFPQMATLLYGLCERGLAW